MSGIRWMINRELMKESGGLLADEMGLGKTIEILGLMKNTKKAKNLLLCPKAVINQWITTATRSCIAVFLMEKDSWKWMNQPETEGKTSTFLYIANYEKLNKKDSVILSFDWHRVILDEGHRAKNRNGIIWQKVDSLKRDTTWVVTATPVVNDLKDIRNLFALIGYDKEKLTNYHVLLQAMGEACLHRSMEEMRSSLPELPKAADITIESLEFQSDDEADFYRGVQGKIAARLSALHAYQSTEIFVLLMQLRQLSIHPQVFVNSRRKENALCLLKDFPEESTKFVALRSKLEFDTKNSRYIVFCQFHDEMDLLENYLNKSKSVKRVQKYSGKLSDAERENVLQESLDDSILEEGHDILLLQLQCGGVGLNLQHFTKIIFMSPWWTAALMDQAIGRSVRIGQKETVEVTMMILKEEQSMNIDDRMLGKADSKRAVLEVLFESASRGLVKKIVTNV